MIFIFIWLTSHSKITSKSIHVSTLYIYEFIHSSVDGHLGYLHVLAIVNNAALNTGMHVSFTLEFYLDIFPGVRLLDHMVVILFFIVVIPVYIPTNSVGGFPFLSPAFIICRLFDDGHSDWSKVVHHCNFDLHLSNN